MAIILALCAAGVYGIADYCGGRASRSVPPMVVTALGQSGGLVVLVAFVVAMGTPSPPASDWVWGGVAGLLGSTGLLAFYRAMASGHMTIVAPVSALTATSLPVAVGLATGDRPGVLALLGIPVAFVAVALISAVLGDRGRGAPRMVLLLALTAGAAFGSIFVILGFTNDDGGLWPVVAMRVTSVPYMLVMMAVMRRGPSRARGHLGIVLASGILDSLANALYLLAVREGMMAVVATINSLYPASTLLLATTLDRERIHRSQAIGLAMAVVALVSIALS